MNLKQAIQERHSVRKYTDRKIEVDTVTALQAELNVCNAESGLHMQLVTEEPKAFSSLKAHYGKFVGVCNYIALIGKREDGLDEKVGYYGERIALYAQTLGLNTCWVAVTFGKGVAKKNCQIDKDEELICVIALGYGASQGVAHPSKPMETFYRADGKIPDWFQAGMDAVMLAPTAVNQQRFLFSLSGDGVKAESTGGFYSKIDLGIVKYHFEVGAGKDNFRWVS